MRLNCTARRRIVARCTSIVEGLQVCKVPTNIVEGLQVFQVHTRIVEGVPRGKVIVDVLQKRCTRGTLRRIIVAGCTSIVEGLQIF